MVSKKVQDIRNGSGESDRKRDQGLTTPSDIVRRDNISYGLHGEWNLMDIYYRKDTKKCQKTIVSIHGGGWVYGTKEVYQFYGMNLAQRGFTVVNFNYRLAPEHLYPAALEDINQVFVFLKEHAADFFVDLNKLIVVGDSAGAQLASQYLTILTNSSFAGLFSFKLPDIKVRAAALNCGFYDVKRCADEQESLPYLEYIGEETEEKLESLNVMKYIDKAFPPTFVMSACNDFLLDYAKPMYEHLKELGVECLLKIYGSPKQKEIAHVFHVNIRLEEAKKCNDEECAFFEAVLQERHSV